MGRTDGRRDVGAAHGERLWTALATAWGFNPDEPYWFPLTETSRNDVVAFQAPYFLRAVSGGALIAALRARGIDRVIEFREGGGTFERAVQELDPEYQGEERYWSSPPWDWILYASHESSTTVGGQWLLIAVQAAWPEWQRHIWTSPDFR
jgi:hypothetical protein